MGELDVRPFNHPLRRCALWGILLLHSTTADAESAGAEVLQESTPSNGRRPGGIASAPPGVGCDNQPLARVLLAPDGGLFYEGRAASQCRRATSHYLDHAIYAFPPARPTDRRLVDSFSTTRGAAVRGELLTPSMMLEVTNEQWYEIHSTASWTFPDGTWKMSYEILQVADLAAVHITSPWDENGDGVVTLCIDTASELCDVTLQGVVIPISFELILSEPVRDPANVALNSASAQLTLGSAQLACSDVITTPLTGNYTVNEGEDGTYPSVSSPASNSLSFDFGQGCALSSEDVRLNLSVNFTLEGTTLSGFSGYVDGIRLIKSNPAP